MIRVVVTAALMLVLVGACLTVAVLRGSEPEATLAGEPAAVTAREEADPTTAPQWLGVVVPRSEVIVPAPVEARITAVVVGLGDAVDAGQPIARLDPEDVRRSLAEARAQLAARQAERRQAEAVRAQKRDVFDRVQRLGTLVSQAERAEAELAAEAARADVERTAAEVRVQRVLIARLEDELRDTTIRAPLTGEVSARLLDPGAQVAAGEPIVRIVEHARRIRFAVDIEAAPPTVGASVVVRCRDGRETQALVTHVAPDIDPATRLLLVEAEPKDAGELRLGETCTTSPGQ